MAKIGSLHLSATVIGSDISCDKLVYCSGCGHDAGLQLFGKSQPFCTLPTFTRTYSGSLIVCFVYCFIKMFCFILKANPTHMIDKHSSEEVSIYLECNELPFFIHKD